MAGYHGYSMSNNAVEAYRDGEKPLSKWTKADIIAAISEALNNEEITVKCNFEKLKKASVKTLKELCLSRSSWHHTSKYYTKTDFYNIDYNAVANIDNYLLDQKKKAEEEAKQAKKEQAPEEMYECAYLEWGGTRNHPKATERTGTGIIKNGWFYLPDGRKKSTTARGFRIIRKIGCNAE